MLREPANPRSVSFWSSKFTNLLFPSVCAACGKLGPMICSPCQSKFPEVADPNCLRCGRPTAETSIDCVECRKESFNLKQARACFAYSEPLTTVIKKLKYDGLFALARPLGSLMALHWPEWDQSPDLIVPIPLHTRRQRVRGFNQSTLLAQQLSPSIGIEVNDHDLQRVRHTKPQVGLTPTQRRDNVWDAFTAEPQSFRGRHILLLDDVFTTGATMTSAANTLLNAGAESVSAYCLARAGQ